MAWHHIMLNPRSCCICRRRICRWWQGPLYLGMRCHGRCARRQRAHVARQAPFRVVDR